MTKKNLFLTIFLFASKVLVVLLIKSVLAVDYCDRNLCSNGLQHVACNNSGNFAATCPADKTMIHFSNYEIQQILDIHNTMRNKVASGGENSSGFKPASKMSMMVVKIYFLMPKIANFF